MKTFAASAQWWARAWAPFLESAPTDRQRRDRAHTVPNALADRRELVRVRSQPPIQRMPSQMGCAEPVQRPRATRPAAARGSRRCQEGKTAVMRRWGRAWKAGGKVTGIEVIGQSNVRRARVRVGSLQAGTRGRSHGMARSSDQTSSEKVLHKRAEGA